MSTTRSERRFEAFDADGDGLRIGPPGEYAEREYQALLAVDNGALYLRRDQVEALRDFLTEMLDARRECGDDGRETCPSCGCPQSPGRQIHSGACKIFPGPVKDDRAYQCLCAEGFPDQCPCNALKFCPTCGDPLPTASEPV